MPPRRLSTIGYRWIRNGLALVRSAGINYTDASTSEVPPQKSFTYRLFHRPHLSDDWMRRHLGKNILTTLLKTGSSVVTIKQGGYRVWLQFYSTSHTPTLGSDQMTGQMLQYIDVDLLRQIAHADTNLHEHRRRSFGSAANGASMQRVIVTAEREQGLPTALEGAQDEIGRIVRNLSEEQVAEYAALLNVGRGYTKPDSLQDETGRCLRHGISRSYLVAKTGFGIVRTAMVKLGIK